MKLSEATILDDGSLNFFVPTGKSTYLHKTKRESKWIPFVGSVRIELTTP